MKKNINNKGSIAFVFYFIAGLALLAVAGYYIGINEQSRLFKEISEKKQAKEDGVLNGSISNISPSEQQLVNEKDEKIKSLLDSPVTVLRNIALNNDNLILSGNNDSESGGELVINNLEDLYLAVAKQSKYFIKTNSNKKGEEITLVNGSARGGECYNDPNGRVCLPKYDFEKIWTRGDLNNDSFDDFILSTLSLERVSSKDEINRSYFAIVFSSSTKKTIEEFNFASSTDASSTKSFLSNIKYDVVPFNYGLYSPAISALEIKDNIITAIGNFYVSTDNVGNPSVSKVIKYKLLNGVIVKSSEARLFKEQGDRVADWLLSNYTFSGLDFTFKTPETWQKEEKFGEQLIVTLKNPDGRNLFMSARKIIQTCNEYSLFLNENKDIVINSSEYIDLGSFGVGFYAKFSKKIDENLIGYYADICVSDKNNDRVVFTLFSSAKEDGDPYFVMFDKIWSTFKIK